MGGWWSGVEAPRRRMLIATTVLFVSQFFSYGEKKSYFLTDLGTDYYTRMASQDVEATGWQIHTLALPVIVVLAASPPPQRRWLYWLAVMIMLLAVLPAAPLRGVGALAGIASLIFAGWTSATIGRHS